MKSSYIGMGIIAISTIFTTLAQLSFKLGSSSIGLSLTSFVFNPYIILGFASYAIAALGFTIALKFGELSLIYPLWSLSFVWITLVSMIFLGEYVSTFNWAGIIFIIAGISFMGFGARHD